VNRLKPEYDDPPKQLPRAPAQPSSHLRNVLGSKNRNISTAQLQTTSPAFAIRGQSSKQPATACHGVDTGVNKVQSPSTFNPPHPVDLLRNDDSMTYVAVTASASSPQSEFDGYDNFSEGSHYTDHEVFENDIAPSWPLGTGGLNSNAAQRRDALLTGLGLSLTNLNKHTAGVPNEEDRDVGRRGGTARHSPDVYEKGTKAGYEPIGSDGYSPPEDHFRVKEPLVDQYDASRIQPDDPPPTTHFLGTTVADQATQVVTSHDGAKRGNASVSGGQLRDSEPNLENRIIGDGNGAECKNQIFEQDYRDDDHRNTWVYDESRAGSLPTNNEGQNTRNFTESEGPNENNSILWSDNDNLEETLGENARKMFDRLQRGDFTKEAPPEEIEQERRYQTAKEPVQYFDDRVSKDEENEAVPSPGPEETPRIETGGIRTWRRTISNSAYQSLLKKHGIIEMKRQDVIFELCETEAAFVKSMRLVIRLFVDPLRSRGE